MNITLKKISEKFNVEFIGDGSYEINCVSSIANATEDSVIFLSDRNLLKFLDETKSQTVVTTKDLSKFCKNNIIICDNPYLLFAKISQLINKQDSLKYNVHSSVVSSTKNLNNKLLIEPNVVIGKNVEIEENSFIGANCYIGDNVKIASGARIFPNVTIYNDVKIGNNIIIITMVILCCFKNLII